MIGSEQGMLTRDDNETLTRTGQGTPMGEVIARRMLIGAAGTVADGGDPPGAGNSYNNVRGIDSILPKESD